MEKHFATSSDNTSIAYNISGKGDTALLFIHGWLGNKDWWKAQSDFFGKNYLIACMDLAGHGESGKTRSEYTAKRYADDIVAVANSLPAQKIILVGHSMSGAYVLEAAPQVKNLHSLIVVDTLKDIEQTMDPKFLDQLFATYRKDFPTAVKNALPQFLFASGTPEEVRTRLQNEFLKNDGDFAVKALAPLYLMDLPPLARALKVPIRAINSDNFPTNKETNQKHFRDYDFKVMKGTGHYPMLERPEEFNALMKEIL